MRSQILLGPPRPKPPVLVLITTTPDLQVIKFETNVRWLITQQDVARILLYQILLGRFHPKPPALVLITTIPEVQVFNVDKNVSWLITQQLIFTKECQFFEDSREVKRLEQSW
ncbi:hypothetical protein ABG067_004182 [Albugo candida]